MILAWASPFNTSYGIAKNCRPFTDMVSQQKNGLNIDQNYIINQQCKQFTCIIASQLMIEDCQRLQSTRFMTVLADGSTKATIVEQETVSVTHVHAGQPITELAAMKSVRG